MLHDARRRIIYHAIYAGLIFTTSILLVHDHIPANNAIPSISSRFSRREGEDQPTPTPSPTPTGCPIEPEDRWWHNREDELPLDPHPIDDLIQAADERFEALLSEEVHNLKDAAAAYRERRGRHPPPRFNEWVAWAKAHNVMLIEEFFDQIYNDLEPFWAVDPQYIRDAAASDEFVLSIRGGKLTTEIEERWWMHDWHDMLKKIDVLLPDVDLAFNIMDESRLLVPHEKVAANVETAATLGRLPLDSSIVTKFAKLPTFAKTEEKPRPAEPEPHTQWIGNEHYWRLVRETCPPDSVARNLEPVDVSQPPTFTPGFPAGSSHGFVSNWTFAKDVCAQPHLRTLHGTFIEPLSIRTAKTFYPILSGSKLLMNNDILIPQPKYWTEEVGFGLNTEVCAKWDGKYDELVWRGVASGGRNKKESWPHFQRHRLLSMLNATHVQDAIDQAKLSGSDQKDTRQSSATPPSPRPAIFPLPLQLTSPPSQSAEIYPLAASSNFTTWITSLSSTLPAGFIDLYCFPRNPEPGGWPFCPYTDPFYAHQDRLAMDRMFDYKYLPDIDGNSFSGRYRAFLQSHSLPIKATVYVEWHVNRVLPWRHFVPMDNTFKDFYGIMDYFVGYQGDKNGTGARRGHDEMGRKLAEQGAEWAARVLRREDMLAYVYRLVLEYARIADERRERMGYIDDLPRERRSSSMSWLLVLAVVGVVCWFLATKMQLLKRARALRYQAVKLGGEYSDEQLDGTGDARAWSRNHDEDELQDPDDFENLDLGLNEEPRNGVGGFGDRFKGRLARLPGFGAIRLG